MRSNDFIKEIDNIDKSFLNLKGITYSFDKKIKDLLDFIKMNGHKRIAYMESERLQKEITIFLDMGFNINDPDIIKAKEQYEFLENLKKTL